MSLKHLEVKKRHHYVWAKYLERWGSGTKNVFYTTKTAKIAHDSVRGMVVEDHFYRTTTLTNRDLFLIGKLSEKSPPHLHQQHMSLLFEFLGIQQTATECIESGLRGPEIELSLQVMRSNALENLHAAHEKSARPVLDALSDEKFDVLQDNRQMNEFMTFFGLQITRTKAFRERMIQRQPRRNAAEIEFADTSEHAWWFLSYIYGVNIGFSLSASSCIDKHALLINNTNVPFITSDQPIVNVHSCVSDAECVPPEYSDLYYPISPRVAYIVCDSNRFKQGRNEIDEKTAIELNSKLASSAMVHIIGDTREALIPFQVHIGRRDQKNLNSPTSQ